MRDTLQAANTRLGGADFHRGRLGDVDRGHLGVSDHCRSGKSQTPRAGSIWLPRCDGCSVLLAWRAGTDPGGEGLSVECAEVRQVPCPGFVWACLDMPSRGDWNLVSPCPRKAVGMAPPIPITALPPSGSR